MSDVLSQLKSYILGLAHPIADATQMEITNAANTARSSNDLNQFTQTLSDVMKEASQKIGQALNQAIDQAQQLGQNQDSDTLDLMTTLMDKAKQMFQKMDVKLRSFIDDAVSSAASFLPQADSEITGFFGDLSTFIDSSLHPF